MPGIIVLAECPQCRESHITRECPTCGYCQEPRAGGSHMTTSSPADFAVGRRRLAIAAIMAEYAAAHPGADEANTNVLDVSLWLSSRRVVS